MGKGGDVVSDSRGPDRGRWGLKQGLHTGAQNPACETKIFLKEASVQERFGSCVSGLNDVKCCFVLCLQSFFKIAPFSENILKPYIS